MVKMSEIRSFIKRTNLDVLITQKGKKISRSTSHEMANNPKQMLAPSSFPEYLKTLAASMNTSLASCRARIIEPMRKNLEMSNVLSSSLMGYFQTKSIRYCLPASFPQKLLQTKQYKSFEPSCHYIRAYKLCVLNVDILQNPHWKLSTFAQLKICSKLR